MRINTSGQWSVVPCEHLPAAGPVVREPRPLNYPITTVKGVTGCRLLHSRFPTARSTTSQAALAATRATGPCHARPHTHLGGPWFATAAPAISTPAAAFTFARPVSWSHRT